MKKHVSAVMVVALAAIALAVLWEPASADAERVRAFVYPDRSQPDSWVLVDDFRVNETVWDRGGVQYVWVRGPAGSFKVSLADVSQIEVVKFVGLTQLDWAQYEVKVTEKTPGVVRVGTMDIRVLLGLAEGEAWYYYPATTKDRGRTFWRIVVGEELVPPTLPLTAPKAAERPVTVAVVPPAAKPAVESADDVFARTSLDDLNAQNLLADTFFDFDKAGIRPDAEAALQRNAEWLKRWASVVVRVEGYADPRGTQEYNLELGLRRAEATRQYLMSLGIPGDRITMVSRGRSQVFCAEQTEECWARNRRAHFVVTAK